MTGTTAKHKLPYPLNTDLVTDGAAVIQQLAQAVDGKLGDVAFTDLAASTAWNTAPTLRLFRVGMLRYLQVDGGLTSVSGTTYDLVANPLAAADRPVSSSVRNAAYFSGLAGFVTVATNGAVQAQQSTGANRGSVAGFVLWVAGI